MSLNYRKYWHISRTFLLKIFVSNQDYFYFVPIFVLPKFELQNSGCSLPASAAYTPVFTVMFFRGKLTIQVTNCCIYLPFEQIIQHLCTLTKKYCFHDWQLLFNRSLLVIVFLAEIEIVAIVYKFHLQREQGIWLNSFILGSSPSPMLTQKILHR